MVHTPRNRPHQRSTDLCTRPLNDLTAVHWRRGRPSATPDPAQRPCRETHVWARGVARRNQFYSSDPRTASGGKCRCSPSPLAPTLRWFPFHFWVLRKHGMQCVQSFGCFSRLLYISKHPQESVVTQHLGAPAKNGTCISRHLKLSPGGVCTTGTHGDRFRQ